MANNYHLIASWFKRGVGEHSLGYDPPSSPASHPRTQISWSSRMLTVTSRIGMESRTGPGYHGRSSETWKHRSNTFSTR